VASGTLKKTARNPLIGSDNKRKSKKGSSIPKTPRKRPAPRFYEVKFRITAEEYTWGLPYFGEQKYLSKFVMESYREKVKRAEAHDKEARQRALVSNMNLLLPVIQELFRQGKLGFLCEK
jgi:hypothetical protein